VIALSQCYKELRKQGGKKFDVAHAVRLLLQQKRIKKVTVPYNFSAGLMRELRALRVRCVSPTPVFPEREISPPGSEENQRGADDGEVGLAEGIQR